MMWQQKKDEDGNLVRSVAYNDQGYPRGVGVYGYIDGMRVNRWGPVVYFDGEGVYATSTELHAFFAQGMLLNIAAAVELGGNPRSWMLEDLEGGV